MVVQSIPKDCDPKHAKDMADAENISKSRPNKGLSNNRNIHRDVKPSSITPVPENGSSPNLFGFDVLSMREEIQTYGTEMQDLLKQRMEDFANTAKLKIESSVKAIGESSRQMIEMELGSMLVPSCFCSKSVDVINGFQILEGGDVLRKQWHEIQMQELDIYGRKLQITKDECDLKQKKMRFYLQLKKNEHN